MTFQNVKRLDMIQIKCQALFVLEIKDTERFSSSSQLSMKFIVLINVKMPTIVGILTLISRINTISECF